MTRRRLGGQQSAFFPLGGGLDLVTPHLGKPPGSVIAALNYEPVASGYKRFAGMERFDGHRGPSSVAVGDIVKLAFTGGQTPFLAIVPGDIIAINLGGALYRAVAVTAVTQTGGNFAFPVYTGQGYLYAVLFEGTAYPATATSITKTTAAGTVLASGSTLTVTANPDLSAFTTATLLGYAREGIRGVITAVGATLGGDVGGSVRGLAWLNDTLYAFRDNAAATAGRLYATSAAGWGPVSLGASASFDQGGIDGTALTEGSVLDTVSGAGTGPALASARRIVVTSGSWASGNAAGFIYSDAGTFNTAANYNNGAYLYASPSGTARLLRLTSNAATFALPPGGSYETITNNFFGASNLTRTYAVNGVGKALELGLLSAATLAIPISTGMVVDTPTHVAEHKGSLFLAFPGGSLQFSAVGEPADFSAIIGAGEIGIGDDITGLISMPDALVILGATSIHVLYGNDASDYTLTTLTREAGAKAHSAQRLGNITYADNSGVRTLATSQAYGNFTAGTLTQLIEPLWSDYMRDGVTVVASLVRRRRSQYWIFFSNGTALVIYLGGKRPSILPLNLGRTVTCALSVETSGGLERLFVGCTDGFVYELEKGTSMDGAAMEHYVRLAFNHFGSPEYIKRVHRALLDLEANGTATITISADYDYGSVIGTDDQVLTAVTGGGALDGLGSNELYYAAQIETTAEAYFDGVAQNISLRIGGSTSTEEPHTLTGLTYFISVRGQNR